MLGTKSPACVLADPYIIHGPVSTAIDTDLVHISGVTVSWCQETTVMSQVEGAHDSQWQSISFSPRQCTVATLLDSVVGHGDPRQQSTNNDHQSYPDTISPFVTTQGDQAMLSTTVQSDSTNVNTDKHDRAATTCGGGVMVDTNSPDLPFPVENTVNPLSFATMGTGYDRDERASDSTVHYWVKIFMVAVIPSADYSSVTVVRTEQVEVMTINITFSASLVYNNYSYQSVTVTSL